MPMTAPTQAPTPTSAPQRPIQRLWRVPYTAVWWRSLLVALLLYGAIFLYFLKLGGLGYQAGTGPLSRFGIIALGLLTIPLAYTLRRRFFRALPGKAQDWLWVHIWFGIVILLTIFLHSNFYNVLREYCYSPKCLAPYYGGPIALDGLLLLVVSGIIGRLLDWRLGRVIAQDASRNGVGIVEALQVRLRESESMVERLLAGKSESFKQYCQLALKQDTLAEPSYPQLLVQELTDFQRACEVLAERTRISQSLHHQRRARLLMHRWRVIHRILACVALTAIGFHLGWLALHVLGARFHL